MRITFTETRVVDDYRKGTPDEERYEAGQTYDLSEASALRWLNRGVARPAVVDAPGHAPAPETVAEQAVDMSAEQSTESPKPSKKRARS